MTVRQSQKFFLWFLMLLYALTIFVSAFLLFLIQPIIAKQILPWFGGTAAVWTTCLVFFQFALLAGYFYSDWLTRKTTPRTAAVVHLALVALALLLLPIIPDASWKPLGDESPSIRILLLLAATIGLPYFLLATTSPLVQAWFARAHPGASPYRLFALSNLASMLALLGYPFLLEPWLATRAQAWGWSAGFALFALLIGLAAWQALRADAAPARDAAPVDTAFVPPPSGLEKLIWIGLSAMGSVLLLAISNHLTQNISSIPLLWVVPLALYLLTFIVCFDAKDAASSLYQRKFVLPLLVLAIGGMMWMLTDANMHFKLYAQIGVFAAGLFIACLFCHGELVLRKPAPVHLTTFYLMVAVGGALGAVLIGLIAPITLPAYFEMEFSLVALGAFALALLWSQAKLWLRVVAFALCAATLGAATFTVVEFRKGAVVMDRNFYGTLRVKEYLPPEVTYRRRSLIHGAILHGDQYLDPPYHRSATTYYKAKSGIGKTILLKEKLSPEAKRIGIVGLGTGTIATYGNKNDVYRFYDINPGVVSIAKRDFTYLKDTDANVEIALGDARLNLEREANQRFDVLAIDAFSSDSIPVHLITVEALDIYTKHMKPDGVIAFHVSNRFLNLKPVVLKIAEARGYHVTWVRDAYDDGSTSSDWILVTKDKTFLLKQEIVEGTEVIVPEPTWRLWTDDYNNLLQVLK